MTDDLIFAGRACLCEYIDACPRKIVRFCGSLLMKDWDGLREVSNFFKTIDGICVLDLSQLEAFDSSLYSVLVWARVFTMTRGLRFHVIASESATARLKLTGIGKWMPISANTDLELWGVPRK